MFTIFLLAAVRSDIPTNNFPRFLFFYCSDIERNVNVFVARQTGESDKKIVFQKKKPVVRTS